VLSVDQVALQLWQNLIQINTQTRQMTTSGA
jgi:hypothetical protein